MGLAVTVVEKAPLYPGICMVRKTHTGPLVDLGMDFEPENVGRMYISVVVCKAIADKIGFVPQAELDELERERIRLAVELDELRAQLHELEHFKASVEETFEGAGFSRRRKKPKEEPVATR